MAIQHATKDSILMIRIPSPRLVEDSVLDAMEKDILTLIDKSTEERVVIDFSAVEFMSSAALGKLVKIHKKCKEYKAKLKLAGVSPDIMEVFKITKLNKLFDM